ncbi:MAG TPA: ATP-binding protein [Flavobacterium sp.]|jgi:signal transduction histidine kinase|nr:ATP-binding protein [Flavobacterium sp.]
MQSSDLTNSLTNKSNTGTSAKELSDEAKLQQYRNYLESVMSSAFYGIAIYKPVFDKNKIIDFTILFTNKEVPGNFGFSVADVTGKTCSEVYPGIFDNGVFQKLVDCYLTKSPQTYEVEVVDKGKRAWFSAAVEYVNGSVTVSSINSTAEKEAADQLTKMNNFLAATNKQLEQVILKEFSESFSSYKTGKDFFDFLLEELAAKTKLNYVIVAELTSVESTLATLSFYADGQLMENLSFDIKGNPAEVVVKGDMQTYVAGVRAAFPNSKIFADFDVEGFIAHPLCDKHNHCLGLIGVMHKSEINEPQYIESLLKIAAKRCEMELERQRNEKLLAAKNAELEKQNKDLASFTYIASHDLQEPLRKIRMFNSRILEKDEKNLSAASLSYLNSINATAGRMQNLIDALLSYSSMDSEDLKKEKVDLKRVLKDVMSMMDDILEDKNVEIIVTDLPSLHIIPLQFQQLLYNIISNAIKYSKLDERPIIKISAEDVELDRISFWKITVADNGIGFDPQYKERIFEVFQRLHGKKEYAGTGVGLAICKKIVQNHHGHITADGIPGEGAVFNIYIPKKK